MTACVGPLEELEEHVSNPLTAYKLVRTLRATWRMMEESVEKSPLPGTQHSRESVGNKSGLFNVTTLGGRRAPYLVRSTVERVWKINQDCLMSQR